MIVLHFRLIGLGITQGRYYLWTLGRMDGSFMEDRDWRVACLGFRVLAGYVMWLTRIGLA